MLDGIGNARQLPRVRLPPHSGLRDAAVLSEEEFAAAKTKLLGG